MAHERGEIGGERHTETFCHGKSGFDDFCEILTRKYGTLTRAWRLALDADESGLLDAREFAAAMDVIGYHGNVRSLWFNLDDDQSGFISLAEIDPAAARALEKFRVRCVKTFGSVTLAWTQCLDRDKSGFLTLPELEAASTQLGYDDMNEVSELFFLLRLDPAAFRVPAHEVLFLQLWEDRKQATTTRAWRKGSRWVNKDPYFMKDPAKIPESWKPRESKVPGPKSPENDYLTLRQSGPQSREPTPVPNRATTTTPPPTWAAARYAPSPGPGSGGPSRSPETRPDSRSSQRASAGKTVPKKACAYGHTHPDTTSHTIPSGCQWSNKAEKDPDETNSAVSEWTDIVGTDKDKAWLDFEEYLSTTFGSLVKAFDVMDTSGDGSIERLEWMNMVTRRLQYCRASEALRLFDSKTNAGEFVDRNSPACRIKYNDFGITTQEYIMFMHDKRAAQQAIKNRNVMMKPPAIGGAGMRWTLASQDHEARIKHTETNKPPEAFWTTLPHGWGFPTQGFINMKAVKEAAKRGVTGSLSARATKEKAAASPSFTAWAAEPMSAR